MVLLIIFIVICGILGFGGLIMDIKAKAETRNEKNTELPKLNQAIDTVYNMFFGNDTIKYVDKLTRLQFKSTQIVNDAKQQYLNSNSIRTTVDTFSNLGKCGVSQTHLYTKVDVFDFDEIYTYNDIVKSYLDCQSGEYYITSSIKRVYSALDMYSRLKKQGAKKVSSIEINLSQLLYYKIEGTVQHVSNVSGGGVNLQGAVAGAIIGGGAAAIIGSQIGTETKTDIVTKDDRKITFYLNGSDGLVTYDVISTNCDKTISALRKLIPNKEESVVQMKARTSSTTAVSSVTDEIKKFKELLDNGIISQEEFDAKKKQLLGL